PRYKVPCDLYEGDPYQAHPCQGDPHRAPSAEAIQDAWRESAQRQTPGSGGPKGGDPLWLQEWELGALVGSSLAPSEERRRKLTQSLPGSPEARFDSPQTGGLPSVALPEAAAAASYGVCTIWPTPPASVAARRALHPGATEHQDATERPPEARQRGLFLKSPLSSPYYRNQPSALFRTLTQTIVDDCLQEPPKQFQELISDWKRSSPVGVVLVRHPSVFEVLRGAGLIDSSSQAKTRGACSEVAALSRGLFLFFLRTDMFRPIVRTWVSGRRNETARAPIGSDRTGIGDHARVCGASRESDVLRAAVERIGFTPSVYALLEYAHLRESNPVAPFESYPGNPPSGSALSSAAGVVCLGGAVSKRSELHRLLASDPMRQLRRLAQRIGGDHRSLAHAVVVLLDGLAFELNSAAETSRRGACNLKNRAASCFDRSPVVREALRGIEMLLELMYRLRSSSSRMIEAYRLFYQELFVLLQVAPLYDREAVAKSFIDVYQARGVPAELSMQPCLAGSGMGAVSVALAGVRHAIDSNHTKSGEAMPVLVSDPARREESGFDASYYEVCQLVGGPHDPDRRSRILVANLNSSDPGPPQGLDPILSAVTGALRDCANKPVHLILDITIEVDAWRLKKLFHELREPMRQRRLQVVLCKSLQKFSALGSGKAMMGLVLSVQPTRPYPHLPRPADEFQGFSDWLNLQTEQAPETDPEVQFVTHLARHGALLELVQVRQAIQGARMIRGEERSLDSVPDPTEHPLAGRRNYRGGLRASPAHGEFPKVDLGDLLAQRLAQKPSFAAASTSFLAVDGDKEADGYVRYRISPGQEPLRRVQELMLAINAVAEPSAGDWTRGDVQSPRPFKISPQHVIRLLSTCVLNHAEGSVEEIAAGLRDCGAQLRIMLQVPSAQRAPDWRSDHRKSSRIIIKSASFIYLLDCIFVDSVAKNGMCAGPESILRLCEGMLGEPFNHLTEDMRSELATIWLRRCTELHSSVMSSSSIEQFGALIPRVRIYEILSSLGEQQEFQKLPRVVQIRLCRLLFEGLSLGTVARVVQSFHAYAAIHQLSQTLFSHALAQLGLGQRNPSFLNQPRPITLEAIRSGASGPIFPSLAGVSIPVVSSVRPA
ncbi:MAG: hypothetical protein AAF550_03465, partial [Myxococcota bacterium]